MTLKEFKKDLECIMEEVINTDCCLVYVKDGNASHAPAEFAIISKIPGNETFEIRKSDPLQYLYLKDLYNFISESLNSDIYDPNGITSSAMCYCIQYHRTTEIANIGSDKFGYNEKIVIIPKYSNYATCKTNS